MAQTYAEFLKSQGASDDDIKVLDHPVARKAWEASQTEMSKVTAAAKKLEADTRRWYDETVIPTQEKLQRERDSAVADAAAERARVKALQDEGLLEVARQQDDDKKGAAAAAAEFDPKKYNLVDQDTLLHVAEREGDAIAIMADILDEHRELFGTRINARELRKEAVARKISVEQLWMEKYNVQAKRQEVADKKHQEEVAKWKAEGAKEKETELAGKYGNPNLSPPVSSANPFTNRFPSGSGDKDVIYPWQRSESDREKARLDKALKSHPLM